MLMWVPYPAIGKYQKLPKASLKYTKSLVSLFN